MGVFASGGNLDVQRLRVLEKGLAINRGEFLQRQVFLARAADGLVVHVGELHDVIDLITEMPQRAPEQIDRDIGAEIADVAVIIDGRPADIEADAFAGGIERLHRLDRAGQRVVELEIRAAAWRDQLVE